MIMGIFLLINLIKVIDLTISQTEHLIKLVWLVPLARILLCPQLIFPSKTSFFGIYLEFSAPEITLKIDISHVSESKSYQINSIKSYSSRSFHQHQRHIPKKNKLKFNLIFREEIIQYSRTFYTASPNVMESLVRDGKSGGGKGRQAVPLVCLVRPRLYLNYLVYSEAEPVLP